MLICCQVSVRYLSLSWITGGRTIHSPIDRLFTPTGIEMQLFRNSVSKIAGSQLNVTKRSELLLSERLLQAILTNITPKPQTNRRTKNT